MLLGSVLDPINVASAFIPVFPAARYAHLVKNLGLTKARAVRGVVEGSVGATLVEPIVLGQAALEQDENYNLLDSFLNVTIGGVLGGGLHVGFGKLSDTIERRSQKTKEQAVLTAVKQVLTDQEVTGPSILIKADLDKSIKKNLEKQNNLAQEKPTRIEDITRTGKGLPGSLQAKKPKTLLQFIKENGKISSIDPLAGDVAQALGGNQNKQGKFILDVKNTKGAVAKKGIGIDEMATRVQEAGYFLDKSDMDYGIDAATPDDLIALIRREQDGEILYSRSQELEYDNYVAAGEKQELVDALDIDPTNMTDAELDIAIDLARNKEQLSQDILLSEKMEQPSVLTAQEFENAKIEAFEKNYNMGNGKQEYEQSVLERAGIDDTFNLQTRETEIDAEIEALEFDIENTSNAENIDKDDLVEFDENIKVADDLIARSDESFDTATNAAASCIVRNTK
jgi:hypothetical protein